MELEALTPAEYRVRARECRERAENAKSLAMYLLLLELAQEYEARAERDSKQAPTTPSSM